MSKKLRTKERTYHYTECGLDYIYLGNGFTLHKTPYGEAVSIDNLDALHQAIGLMIVHELKQLTGQEVRFLRAEMRLSQKKLAQLLGVEEQTVHRWEKNKTEVTKGHDRIIRLLYLEQVKKTIKPMEILAEVSQATLEPEQLPMSIFKEHNHHWRHAAA